MDISIKGNSGCQIKIANEADGVFLYKITRDPHYGRRLVCQAAKQQVASRRCFGRFYAPAILGTEQNEKGTCIKMEYVYSKDFIEYFDDAGFDEIHSFCDDLILFIEEELQRSPLVTVLPETFQNKFQEVRCRISANNMVAEAADPLIRCATKVFSSLNPLTIPVGICHGDLIFSNMLFTGKGYCLIDFLDSFIESPLIDLVKIRQDTFFHWSQHLAARRYDSIRLDLIYSKIDCALDSHFTKYGWYRDYYSVFQLMNLLRILPYVKDKPTLNLLINGIYIVLHEL